MPLGRHLSKHIDNTLAPRYKTRGGNYLENVDVTDFLETLEAENLQRGSADEMLFSCPFSGHTSGDATPSAYMNDGGKDKSKTTVWKCHGCGRAGNAVTFLAELQGLSKHEAALFIRETWAPGFRAPKGGSISAEFEQRLEERLENRNTVDEIATIAWEHYDRLFSVDWRDAYVQYRKPHCPPAVAYLFTRGMTAETLRHWRIGYDEITDRLTIPVSIDGQLVGIKARTWRDYVKPKYRILGDKSTRRPRYGFLPYEKSRMLFGLDQARGTTLVLCEGELDVIALWQMGISAVCTGSSHVSGEQALALRDAVEAVTIWQDNDPAGERATWGWEDKDHLWHPGVVERLAPHLQIRIVSGHRHDPAKYLELGRTNEVAELVAGAQSHIRFMA